jgi:superfamily II RNA helicase
VKESLADSTCGRDDEGICILMVGERLEASEYKDIMLGKPGPLMSRFRLSYHMILNFMRKESATNTELIIRNSLCQYQ